MRFGSGLIAKGAHLFRDIPIRLKLALIIGLAIGFALMVAFAAVLTYESRTFKPRALEKAEGQAKILSEILAPPLLFNDSSTAEHYLATFAFWQELEAAALYDAHGKFFAGYRRNVPGHSDIPERAPVEGARFRSDGLTLSAAIPGEKPAVNGFVWLEQPLPPLYARLPQYGIMFGVVTLSLLAVAALLALALKHSVSVPITSLARVARSVITNQDYSLRAPAQGRDEIGDLTDAFNQMLEKIGQRDLSLGQAIARNEAILNTTIDGVAMEDEKGRFLDVNQACCLLLGYTRQEMLQLAVKDINVSETPEAIEQRFRDIREKGRKRYEIRVRTKAGRLLDIEVATAPYEINGFRFLSALRDVTERKRAEAALRESEERFSKAFHANPTPMSILRVADDKIFDINESNLQMLGYAREEVVGHESLELGIIDTSQRKLIRNIMEKQGSIRNLEIKVRTKSGAKRDALISVQSIELAGERCYLATSNDITERKLVEEQLRQSQKMDAIGRLAGGIAHDFNNLLTAINGYSGMALQGIDASHPMYEYMSEIHKAGERAAALTRQLLAYSRKQVLEPKLWDLNYIVRDLAPMLKRLIGENIELITALQPNPLMVKVDRGQMEQIVLNLSVNARDAMPKGGRLTFETRSVALDPENLQTHLEVAPGPYAMLAVSDTGTGMPPEVKAKLFEPFFTTKEVGKGTGLGLSVVYGILKQSGGSISVYSEMGKGTTFRIYLPEVPMAKDSSREPMVPERLEDYRGNETVLLVEDEAPVRRFARHALEAQGYTILEAASGSSALDILRNSGRHFDLIITDVIMPGMGGLELARRVRRLRKGKPVVPVLFISGYTEQAFVQIQESTSSALFLQKPFSPFQLARKVRESLNRVEA